MHLKQLRTKLGLTQQYVAEKMSTTQQTIQRWETGKAKPNVDQIKELCVVLECGAAELLGVESATEEETLAPFARGEMGAPYGTLTITTTVDQRDYPIDEKAREAVLDQLDPFTVPRSKLHRYWLKCWTLDNRILRINPRFVREIALVGDDAEAMPSYQHPEVYRALERYEDGDKFPGQVLEGCKKVVAELGMEVATKMVTSAHVIFADGSDAWYYLTDETAATISLWDSHFDHDHHAFIQVMEEDYYQARFVNPDHVVMVELPYEAYLRLSSEAMDADD